MRLFSYPLLQRLSSALLRTAAMWQPGDLVRPDVQLCGLPEIAAGKICALLDRCKSRDLFDVIRLPQAGSAFWSSPPFKKLVVAFTGTLDHPLHAYGRERMERVRAIDIEAELVPMLGGQAKINRGEFIDSAWSAVAPLLDLDAAEREFVDRLQVGDLHWDPPGPRGRGNGRAAGEMAAAPVEGSECSAAQAVGL